MPCLKIMTVYRLISISWWWWSLLLAMRHTTVAFQPQLPPPSPIYPSRARRYGISRTSSSLKSTPDPNNDPIAAYMASLSNSNKPKEPEKDPNSDPFAAYYRNMNNSNNNINNNNNKNEVVVKDERTTKSANEEEEAKKVAEEEKQRLAGQQQEARMKLEAERAAEEKQRLAEQQQEAPSKLEEERLAAEEERSRFEAERAVEEERLAEEGRVRFESEWVAEEERLAEEERVRFEAEQAAEEELLAEEERVRFEAEQAANEERLAEEERFRFEAERAAEEELLAEEERLRFEAEQAAREERLAEEERVRFEAEQAAEEELLAEEERLRFEAEQAAEEERLAQEERVRFEAEQAAEEERRAEEERLRFEAEQAAEEERLAQEARARFESEKAEEERRAEEARARFMAEKAAEEERRAEEARARFMAEKVAEEERRAQEARARFESEKAAEEERRAEEARSFVCDQSLTGANAWSVKQRMAGSARGTTNVSGRERRKQYPTCISQGEPYRGQSADVVVVSPIVGRAQQAVGTKLFREKSPDSVPTELGSPPAFFGRTSCPIESSAVVVSPTTPVTWTPESSLGVAGFPIGKRTGASWSKVPEVSPFLFKGQMGMRPRDTIISSSPPPVGSASLSEKAKNIQKVTSSTVIQGQNSLKTWSFKTHLIDRVHVMMATEGRPMNVLLELWQGPDNIPQTISMYSENGKTRPFNTIIETPRGDNSIAIRNTGPSEFPVSAGVVAELSMETPQGSTELLSVSQKLVRSSKPKTIQGGGAVRSFNFGHPVQSIQIFLETDGRPLDARIEVLQGPNNDKQVLELYSEDGHTRPFLAIIETPGQESVVRIVNTATTTAYPFVAYVEPYTVESDTFSTSDIHKTGMFKCWSNEGNSV